MNAQTQSDYESCIMSNYGRPMGEFVRAEGLHVWDANGKKYLDFGSGVAVSAIGHCHPSWVQAIQDQAATMGHISNLYAHAKQGELARRLCDKAGPGKLLFCNSGAEANEACLKLARLHGKAKAGKEGYCYKVITAENGFHGRTFGAMAATPQEKIQGGFRPMLDGFTHAPYNDVAAFAQQIDDQTAAIFVESIQGEGGLTPATPAFLQGLRELCDTHGLLLILDEVQCGIGRTGDFFAYEASGVQPDVVAMAKGLGGGVPIGAVWVNQSHAELFQPGSHGTTFGGGPLVCAAALAVLDVIEQAQLLANVAANTPLWHKRLRELQHAFPEMLLEIRGRGYMTGLRLATDPKPLVQAAMASGLLTIPAGQQVLRLLPPLTATLDDLMRATDLLEAVFAKAAPATPIETNQT